MPKIKFIFVTSKNFFLGYWWFLHVYGCFLKMHQINLLCFECTKPLKSQHIILLKISSWRKPTFFSVLPWFFLSSLSKKSKLIFEDNFFHVTLTNSYFSLVKIKWKSSSEILLLFWARFCKKLIKFCNFT